MKLGTGYFRVVGDKVRAAVLDVSEWGDNTYLLTRLNVPKDYRGQGIGTELMKEVTEDADKEGATLLIEPRPYGEITRAGKRRLIEFYKRFGFVERKNKYMIRKPRKL